MRVYVAAPFEMRDELRSVEALLKMHGHECMSRWFWVEEEGSNSSEVADFDPDDATKMSVIDFEDVFRSNAIINFTTGEKARGGRHVEFGMGLALNRHLIVVGPREHIFHHYPQVHQVEDIDSAIQILNELQEAGKWLRKR